VSQGLSIAIRCETGIDKGFGHAIRMMTLAKALQEQHGAEIRFLCDGNPMVEQLLETEGFRFGLNDAGLSEEDFVQRETGSVDIVVLDNKRDYSAAFVRSLRLSRSVVFVDHCSPGAFESNLTIFPCAALSSDVIQDSRWVNGHSVLLHGGQFVLLGRKVLELRQRRGAARNDCGPIVLTTGGRDPRGVLLVVMPWLVHLPAKRDIVVLAGEAFAHPRELACLKPRLPAHVQILPYSPDRLAGAAIAVCTFGVTTYELMFLGTPSLVIGHSRENAETSRILAERCRATIDLGYVGNLREKEFIEQLSELIQNRERRRELSKSGLEQIDGLGAERMAERIVALSS
jgi:spore coat polysaccharide biosynthesis predicted glycosyltransferase SpsG